MDQIIVLSIKYQFGGQEEKIHPVVLLDDNNMVLVDCGYPGFLPLIELEFKANNLEIGKLTHIMTTHHDHDHMGALYELKKKYPNIKIVAGSMEEPYISGARKYLRLEQAEKMQDALPMEQKQAGIDFCNMLKEVKPVDVDITVQGGDVLDWCGGCTILETFGHTAGHISLYLTKHRKIIAGDAAVLENNSLILANPQYTFEIDRAEASLQRIINFGAEEIICYHGGIWRSQI